MPTVKSCPPWQRAVITQSAVITGAVILAFLYVGRTILIPIAMALFFSYVLAPVVRFLSRRGVGHGVSVVLAVAVATGAFLGTSFVITRQITSLTQSLAQNKEKLAKKIEDTKHALSGGDPTIEGVFNDIQQAVVGGVRETSAAGEESTVVVGPSRPKWMGTIDQLIGPVTEAFGMAAFSFILVVFILLAKEDLRDRLLRLTGDASVSSTTRAIDDATTRLSQYLLAQLTLNVAFGLVVALGLWLLGVQYALTWGFIGTLMRYVPYLGTWIGLILPALYSFATSDWAAQPVLVIALFGVLELLCGNVIEPFLYGQKLGVSEVAQLVSAAFWSFLWGPIGLILSGPIATCLVVLGRHSPRFRFLQILLGTEPPLSPAVALFQRLMTGDTDEALKVIEKNTPADAPDKVYDDLIVPALVQVKAAMHSGEFTAEEIQVLVSTAREVVAATIANRDQAATDEPDPIERSRLLVIPARDAGDQVALDMLAALLPFKKWKIDAVGVDTLAAELVERVNAFRPDVVCIGSLPPAGVVQVRYLCKRLRQHNRDVRILIGRWGDAAPADAFAELQEVGATAVEVKVESTLAQLAAWRPIFATEGKAEKSAPNAGPVGTASAPTKAVVS